jgi:hypothetical protein
MTNTLNDDSELEQALTDIFSEIAESYDEATIWAQRKKVLRLIHQRDEARDTASRLDELCHTDGLFECFKTTRMPVMKRVGELRAKLDRFTNPEKGTSNA